MGKRKCFMWRYHTLKKQWMCSALLDYELCGPKCPFYKTKEEQLLLEEECIERLKKYYPELAKKYQSSVPGVKYVV